MHRIVTWLLCILGFFTFLFCLCKDTDNTPKITDSKTIVIGSKNFTESIVLAHMAADIIEDQTDYKVIRKVNLGGSSLAWKALKNNDIQMYPEYVNTIVLNHYNQKPAQSKDAIEQAQNLLKQDGIKFTSRFGVNNKYALAVSQEAAQRHQLQSISDLITVSPAFRCGSDFEFIDRPDGWKSLVATYNLKFKNVKGMDHGIVYRAIQDDKLDVVVGFTTDSQLHNNKLVILEDDKEFCGCYDAGILIRQDVLDSFPDLDKALKKLENILTDQEMRKINLLVDYEGLKAKSVAKNFLIKQGLLTRKQNG